MIVILLTTFGAVFAAEVVGDKLVYTAGILATQYPRVHVMSGMTLAFMAKMGVAVMVGEGMSRLPSMFVALGTGTAFLSLGITLWLKADTQRQPKRPKHVAPGGAFVAFATVLLAEWGDIGQVTAATIAARFQFPWIVWLGAVSAMVTKVALAAVLGGAIRRWIQDQIPAKALRYAGVCGMLLLAAASAVGVLANRR